MIGNVFHLVESRGIPLDIILIEFERNNLLVDWLDFFEQSQKGGWNTKTTLNKIRYALDEVKGKEYTEHVLMRLIHILQRSLNETVSKEGEKPT